MKKSIYFFLTALAISSVLGIFFAHPTAYAAGVAVAVLLWDGLKSVIFEKKRQTIPWLLLAIALPFLYSLSWPQEFDGIVWLTTLVAAFFEEIGWRGFLFKKLEKFGWVRMNIVIGFLWAAWHLPAILTGYYPIATPLPIGFFFFFANLILLSFLFGWFRQKTGGLVAPILLHMFHNLSTTGNDIWESSAGLMLTLMVTVILFQVWKKPAQL